MNTQNTLPWAISLLRAAIVASLLVQTCAAAIDDRPISGLADTAGAFVDVGASRPARLIVYQTDNGELGAVACFRAGTYTFRYSPDRGASFCPLPWGSSDQALASSWCHRTVRWAHQMTWTAALRAARATKGVQHPNGCLIDSLLAYDREARNPDANWEGVFVLFRGVEDLGGGHAVCIDLVGTGAWVYDPIGSRTSCLGLIDLQSPLSIARKFDPDASGGWLEARDLAWLRRHDPAFTSNQTH